MIYSVLLIGFVIRNEAVHNFSSYNLSRDELDVLSYGLNHHIPGNVQCYKINTEFKLLYKNIVRAVSDLPEYNIDRIKTKLGRIC